MSCFEGFMKRIYDKKNCSLHCSARQPQRILNQCEAAGLVRKLGKATYRLGGGKTWNI